MKGNLYLSELHKPGIGILASGDGSNTEALIHATQNGILDAEVRIVVTNNPNAGVIERIPRLNEMYGLEIRGLLIGEKRGSQQTPYESEKIAKEFSAEGIVLVALLGYSKRVTGDLFDEYGYHPHFTANWQARMVNPHRGPLPLTKGLYGAAIERKILASGIRRSETTVHVVAQDYDTGPTIITHPFSILPPPLETEESLRKMAKEIETRELPFDINNFLKVHLKWGRHNPGQSSAVKIEVKEGGGYSYTPPQAT